MIHIRPENDLWDSLLRVAKPGRYVGGEFGIVSHKNEDDAKTLFIALSFPDLYEIGMSNHAVKILYSLLNSLPHVVCERVFAPAPDFEEELRTKNMPLYSLESGRPLSRFDVICFSVGYELCATNILTILDRGHISILSKDRSLDDPVIMAGGPAVTNPLPFSLFIDYFFIGEAEGRIEALCTALREIKCSGGKRRSFIEYLAGEPNVWSKEKPDKVVKKHTWMGFSETLITSTFPVPNIKVVQDHGVTEIMRGCPNNCRFCHASIYYRPFRFKKPPVISSEIEDLILKCGYRNITLSSLSTGDYSHIDLLIRNLSERYKHAGISFALPSLRINTLSLSLLEDISSVRKSGLTFAVETPDSSWQSGLNKDVSMEKTIALLLEAQKRGWRAAKFYFMIGLPVYEHDESDAIIEFLKVIKFKTNMALTINISTFIPKPHTPFQWAPQLGEEEALKRIYHIKRSLPGKKFKVTYHSPFASFIEGIISRGSYEVGSLIIDAYKKGARLDAWDEYIRKDIWREVLNESNPDIINDSLRARKDDEKLPWEGIHLGVSHTYLRKEWEKSVKKELTEICSSSCCDQCGACNKTIKVEDFDTKNEIINLDTHSPFVTSETLHKRILYSFKKSGKAAFLSHLNCMLIFERTFLRAGYLLRFTKGFNPKPILEFASPLSLGLGSHDEIVSCEIDNFDSVENVIQKINRQLPPGFEVTRAKVLPPYIEGTKKTSLAGQFWGSDFFLESEHNIEKIIHIFSQINNVCDEENEFHEFTPVLDSFFMLGKGICIRWKQIEKKGFNIQHFIRKLTGQMFYEQGITITRLNSLAKGKENQPEHYFDVM
ncbi:MAG: DUF2344 domain-containing protein [Spirochaetales bacterium]|nr:DUF2344 domain-containing protein [Spirochaetales bacterium]